MRFRGVGYRGWDFLTHQETGGLQMKRLIAAIVLFFLLGGCGPNYDGRYPIDSMRLLSEGSRVTKMVNETFPLDAWF